MYYYGFNEHKQKWNHKLTMLIYAHIQELIVLRQNINLIDSESSKGQYFLYVRIQVFFFFFFFLLSGGSKIAAI